MNRLQDPAPRLRHAFTLLELLVAMAVFALLVVLLMGMVDAASKLWRQNETRVDAYREARAALNVITDDLRDMVISTNAHFFATNFVKAIPEGADPADPALFFLAPLPLASQPSTNKSDLCAVGYFRRWAKQTVGIGSGEVNEGYHLFRSFYGSDLTRSNLVSGISPLEDLGDPSLRGEPMSEILARNICDFEVICYTTNGAAGAQKYVRWTPASGSPPQLVEVRVTAIPNELAQKLGSSKTAWTTNNPLISQAMRTFTSRIPISSVQP